jgi:uridine kinase
MQVAQRNSAFWAANVRFQGKPSSGHKPAKLSAEQLHQRLQAFEEDFYRLLRWDKATHVQPVIKSVNMFDILTQAKRFLKEQNETTTLRPFTLAVAGGTATGKTTAAKGFLDQLREAGIAMSRWSRRKKAIATFLSQDNFYRDNTELRRQHGDAFFQKVNLDTWTCFHLAEYKRAVESLKSGLSTRIRKYDFTDSSSTPNALTIRPTPFLVTEGLFTLMKPFRKIYDLKILFEADRSVVVDRFWRRAQERNFKRDASGEALLKNALEMQEYHVDPTRPYANLVLNANVDKNTMHETMGKLAEVLVRAFAPKSP